MLAVAELAGCFVVSVDQKWTRNEKGLRRKFA